MRNDFVKWPVFSYRNIFFYLILPLFFIDELSAQTTLDIPLPITNGIVTIKTNITKDPIDSGSGESSYGFFYRIDSDPANDNDNISGNTGSFYWRADILIGTTEIEKSINLPPGKYSLVAYQTRKSKPIKTIAYKSPTNNSTIFEVGGSNAFQPVTWGSTTPNIKLEGSWNVFTDTGNAVADDHYSNTPSFQTLSEPWLIVSLTLQDWPQRPAPIFIQYNDEFFEYKDAITGNKKHSNLNPSWALDIFNLSTTATQIDPSIPGEVVIKRGTPPVNSSGQTHIHLIFKRNANAPNLNEVKFIAKWEGNSTVDTDTLLLSVKPKPHDPNNLAVNKKTICPCNKAINLRYRVEFQNIGTGPVQDVRVVLMDTDGLDVSSLAPFGDKTLKKGVKMVYHMGPRAAPAPTFDIPGINLPGTNQAPPNSVPDDETWDYLEFTVNTKSCLKDNTFIRPKARVIFADVPGYLDTNIGETHVLYSAGESNDPGPIPCTTTYSLNCRNCKNVDKPVEIIKRN